MTKDYEGLSVNPFGNKKLSKKKSSKSNKNNNSNFWAVNPFPNKKSSNSMMDDPDNMMQGLIDAGNNIHGTIKTIKKIKQQRMKVPTDPDKIIRRAKSIKAKQKKDKQVEYSKQVIIEHNEHKARNKILDKHGYIKGRRLLREREDNPSVNTTKAKRLRKFLRRK